jgi:hypothetical protein
MSGAESTFARANSGGVSEACFRLYPELSDDLEKESGPLMRLSVRKVVLEGRGRGLDGIAFEVECPLA